MKLAIILGGSRGLGEALSTTYLEQNWEVYEFSRSAPHAHSIQCDLASRQLEEYKKHLEIWAEQDWDEIHLIHNAARLGKIGPVNQGDPQDWLQSMDLNFGSVIWSLGLFTQVFQNHRARKVCTAISSGASKKDYEGWALYCSTKAALERFVTCLAQEQKSEPHPIFSVLIDPGVMDTQMQSQIRGTAPEHFPYLDRFLQLKADNALPSPEEVAKNIYQILNASLQQGHLYSAKGNAR